MATVYIPTPLRRLTAGQSKVDVPGSTVGEVLRNLDAQYPGMGERLFDEKGGVKRFINVFVDDKEIRTLQGLNTPVPEGAKVSIVPAMAGGQDGQNGSRRPTRLTRDQLMRQVMAQIKEMTVEELHGLLDREPDLVLIDIREPYEVEQGHIPGAEIVSRGFLELWIDELARDADQPIVIYCAGGVRSALAAKALQDMGYRNVYSLAGGIHAWQQAGYPIEKPRVFTPEQRERYSRHFILPDVGEKGQAKLLDAKVLLIGGGGLGSPAALYLAAAGVGTIGIVDHDRVDLSNLQRQILYTTEDIGRPKVEVAAERLRALNPDINIVTYPEPIYSGNALDIIRDYDIVINGSDNFPTRYLVNDACVLLRKPLVDASIFMFEGQVTVYQPAVPELGIEGGPCYRCLYPDPPPPGEIPSCAEAGVLGILPGVIGTLQATEAIKLILGIGEPLVGRLLMYDALAQEFRVLQVQRDPNCPVCGDNPTIRELIDYEQFCGMPAPRPSGNGQVAVHA